MVIVAAVDTSDRSEEVVQQAEVLAEAFGDTIHVVHVVTSSEATDMGRDAASKNDRSFSVHDAAAEVASEAAATLEVANEAVGLIGDPATAIVDYADEHDTRYIVVAGRKRSPAGKMIFGSVTQSVLIHASCPVVSSIK